MGRHALLIGTTVYHADRSLPLLPSALHDVQQLKAALDEAGDFDSVDALLDPASAEMVRRVDEFFAQRRGGDLALLYYSGHGVLHTDGQSLFLATTDTVAGRPHGTAFDTDGQLRHMLNNTKARHKVVLLDCCNAGAFSARPRLRGGLRDEPRRGIRERGTFYLTSSTYRQSSKVQAPDRPSVFTEAALEGLRGAIEPAGDSEWITTNDLARHVMAAMSGRGAQTPVESSEGVTEPARLVRAATAGNRPVRHAPGRRAVDPDVPFDADQWRRLLGYYVACLKRAVALESFVDPAKRDTHAVFPAGPERVLSAAGPVPIGGAATSIARSANSAQLMYGYLVAAVKPPGSPSVRLAPLLVADVTVGPDGMLHATYPPRPNPALAEHAGLSEVETGELRDKVERMFVPGDAQSVATVARLLTDEFGLAPVTDLDPAATAGAVRPAPLGRVQNAGLLFVVSDSGGASQQLAADLQDIVTKPQLITETALSTLAMRDRDSPDKPVLVVTPDRLNEAQEQIITAAMNRRLTVAQGPPGTGKSQLVAALVATATADGQTVLVGSTNNDAVNAVCAMAQNLVGPGLILRTGNKSERAQEPERIARILAAAHRRTEPSDPHTPQAELRLAAQEIDTLRGSLDERCLLERDLADLASERAAEFTAAPLPASGDELTRLLHLTARATCSKLFSWWYRRRLRARGYADQGVLGALHERLVIEHRWRDCRARLAALADETTTWERLIELTGSVRPERSVALLRAQIDHRVAAGEAVLRARADEMARPNGRSWSGFRHLLAPVPAWATTAMSARRMPLRPALFDLVIIDEAAQCAIPAILPMLFRAKRALVIGDPRQLEPVISLPRPEDRRQQGAAGLAEDWLDSRRLGYATDTAYDAFAAAAGESFLLDEHYRCHPAIADGPNREVYQGRLTVLTDPRRLVARAERAVRWHHVAGTFEYGSAGSGCNRTEAHAVADVVATLRGAYPEASIGVTTPLARHRREVARVLSEARVDGMVECKTIHQFQGSERDIMVISPVGAHGVRDRTKGWLVRQTNLWNVAITRAQSQLVIVGDRSWWSAQRGLLATLAAGVRVAQSRAVAPEAADRLHAALQGVGLQIRRDVTIDGRPFGLVLHSERGVLHVLVDDTGGDADGRSFRKGLAVRDVVAADRPVRRVPVWRCLAEPEAVAAELRAAVG